tara:strand:- start:1293 stop:1934 length:642 start_codon:yes stop_codon:yes gene_type:complete
MKKRGSKTVQRRKPVRVKVYKNLHRTKAGKAETYSVVDLSTGKVIAYADQVVMDDVHFRVQRRGREKVLKTKRKNVHAAVHGDLHHLSGVDREGKPLKMDFRGFDVRHRQTRYEQYVRKVLQWDSYADHPVGDNSTVTSAELFEWFFSRYVNGKQGGTWVRYNPYEHCQFIVDKNRHLVSTADPYYSSVLEATAVFIGDKGVIVSDAVHKYLR